MGVRRRDIKIEKSCMCLRHNGGTLKNFKCLLPHARALMNLGKEKK